MTDLTDLLNARTKDLSTENFSYKLATGQYAIDVPIEHADINESRMSVVIPLSGIPPTRNNSPNSNLAHFKFFRKNLQTWALLPTSLYLFCTSLSKYCIWMAFPPKNSSISFLVLMVILWESPAQIIKSIIHWNPIKMSPLHSFWTRSYKSSEHELMNFPSLLFSFVTDSYVRIQNATTSHPMLNQSPICSWISSPISRITTPYGAVFSYFVKGKTHKSKTSCLHKNSNKGNISVHYKESKITNKGCF